MTDDDLVWLERVELPLLTWQQASAYQQVAFDRGRAPNPTFDAIDRILARYEAIDDLGGACVDVDRPLDERDRIARAFFRVAAWELVASNELNEGQKAWLTAGLTKKAEADRILAIWSASADPHAALVRGLREALPEATAKDIARVVEHVCDGWGLACAPPRVSRAERKTIVKRLTALAARPAVVDAVRRWLPDIPDFERRVLHAGAVLAIEGSARSAAALREVLVQGDRAWALGIWSQLAPTGSAVAALT